jgi:hypothetical protein
MSIDLHDKPEDDARHGIPECPVYIVNESRLRWFDLRTANELQPELDGTIRMVQFPGPWIDRHALAARDYLRLDSVLRQGLSSAEHVSFPVRLGLQKS